MSKPVLSDRDHGLVSRVLNLPAPVDPNEAARLADVSAAIEGVAWKDSVRVRATANVNLSAPGAAIDGVTMAANDRALLPLQTTTSEIGVYIWNGAGVAMTRAADCSTAAELEQAIVTVEEGTSAGTSWRQTAVNFTLGTDPVAWTSFGVVAPAASESTAGVAEVATQAETDAGADDTRFVSPAKLANYSGRAKRYAADIGDGSATSFTLTHNLGTRDVHLQVRRNSGSYEEVEVDWGAATINTVVVVFASAPSAAQYRGIVTA